MATDNKQKAELIENERKNLGLEELGKLGKKAAFATGGVKMIEKVAEVAERKAAEVVENVALQKQKSEILQAGEQAVGTGVLLEAEKAKAEIQNATENTAKETYNKMIQQRAEQEEKKAQQKKKVTVKGPKPTSVVTEAAKKAFDPKDIMLSVPGVNFVWGAKKGYDVFKKFLS